jgi:Protein of unknown function (DUF2798)
MKAGRWSAARCTVKKGWAGDPAMIDAKARLILALLMSSVMVFMVTLLVTYLNLGFDPDFLRQWTKAYFIAWPVAATTAFFIMPPARHLTDRIVALIDGQR